MKHERISVLGVEVDQVTPDQVLAVIDEAIRTKSRTVVTYVNIHAVNLACTLPWFREFLNSAHVSLLDGEGVRLGARLLGRRMLPPVALTRFFWSLCDHCSRRSHRLFLLGSTNSTLERVIQNATARYPSLAVAGVHHGYFAKAGSESEAVVDEINCAEPDVLLVAFGMPLQEEWVRSSRDSLHVPVIVMGGGCLEVAAGTRMRVPQMVSKARLEWLFRMVQEPRRLWKRYLIGIPRFFGKVAKQRFVHS